MTLIITKLIIIALSITPLIIIALCITPLGNKKFEALLSTL